jgi:F0F1-type ATP synthase membrane subunit b/b'
MAAEHGAEIVLAPGIKEAFVLVHTVLLGVVFYVAGKKGILSSLKDRHDAVRKRLVDSKHELDHTRTEIEKARKELASLEATQKRIVAETEEEGRKFQERIIQDAHVTAQRILADAKVGAEQEVKFAGEALRKQLLTEAVKQAREILEGTAQQQAHEALVNKFLDDMSIALTKDKSKPAPENFDNGK